MNIGLTFDIEFVQARPGVVLRRDGYKVRCARATHSVDAWSYLFEEAPRPGVFDSKRAVSLGIPEGKKWSALQHGRSVVLGGKKIHPREVLGPARAGRKIGYSGDTRPSRTLARLFGGADVVIFDSTFATRDADKAKERMHSTAAEAAALAKRAGAKKLVLTHFSARYRNVSKLVKEAAAIFPDSVAAYDGLVIEVPSA
jgi:ribonuclease Z